MPTVRKPGTKPLPEDRKPPELDPRIVEAQQASMPWMVKRLERKAKQRLPPAVEVAVTGLQAARAEALAQAGYVQDLVFDDWYDCIIEDAQAPSEWTQARNLYESYLAHGRTFGRDMHERRAAVQALATETQWGRMMATRFPKVRRGSGWHYPVKLRPRRAGA
jgi:hypothetical protein